MRIYFLMATVVSTAAWGPVEAFFDSGLSNGKKRLRKKP